MQQIIMASTVEMTDLPIFLEKWINAIYITQIFLLVLPLKVLISYLSVVVISPTVNKLFYIPFLQLFGVFILILGTYLLYLTKNLNLLNFIYVDILAYSVVNIPWLYVYYKEYYKVFVLKKNA